MAVYDDQGFMILYQDKIYKNFSSIYQICYELTGHAVPTIVPLVSEYDEMQNFYEII